jgi:hypothetical protein
MEQVKPKAETGGDSLTRSELSEAEFHLCGGMARNLLATDSKSPSRTMSMNPPQMWSNLSRIWSSLSNA